MTSVTKFVRCNGLVVVSRFGYLQSLFDYEAVDCKSSNDLGHAAYVFKGDIVSIVSD